MSSIKSAYINVIFSMVGVVFNTIIPIIVFPYITRVLGVDGIGKYSFYNSIFTYAALFTGFGIALYGAREIGKCANYIQRRSQLLAELITINLIVVAVSFLFIAYFAFFSSYRNDCTIILIFSLTLLANAIGAEWFFVGIERQGFMLARNIIIKTLSTIMIFLLVNEPEHLIRYIAILVFSLMGTSITNIYYWMKLSDLSSIHSLYLSKHIKPLLSIFSIDVLLRFIGLGDIVILGVMTNEYVVGIYSMGLKVFLLMSSIMKVTATTLMPRSAYYVENNDFEGLKTLFISTIRMLFMVGLPISACMYIFAEPIIIVLGGEQFAESILLMKGMSIFILLSVLINTFVFQALYPHNKVKSIIWAHAAGLLINIILNIVLTPSLSYNGTFVAFVISYLLIAIVLVIMEHRLFVSLLCVKSVINYLYSTIIATIACRLISIIIPECIGMWLFMFAIFCIVYLLSLKVLNDDMYLKVERNLLKANENTI